MSRFELTRIAFIVFIVLTGLAGLIFTFNPILYLLISGIAFLTIVIVGSFSIQLNFYIKSLCFVGNTKNKIALTFDDGPDKEVTPLVLDLLKKYDMKATFFLIGNKVAGVEDLVTRTIEEGHQIGNHSYRHSIWLDFYSYKAMKHEFLQTNLIFEKMTGKPCTCFRPPFGVTTPTMAKVLKELKYVAVGWSKRSLDTVIDDNSKIIKRASKNLKSGDIVLFHDNNIKIVEILEEYLGILNQKMLTSVTINELAETR